MSPLLRCASLVLMFTIFGPVLLAQTAGSGIVGNIESKSQQLFNDRSIADLNQQHLETYSLEQEALQELMKKLSLVNEEMELALSELRKGRFCVKCKRTALQIEREDIETPSQHFARNGGTRAATVEELKDKENEFGPKIALLKARIAAFNEGNEFSWKRDLLNKEMEEHLAGSAQLREEIVALSKLFKATILQEAKELQSPMINDLMQLSAEKHHLEDEIDLLKFKVRAYHQEEVEAVATSDKKIRQETGTFHVTKEVELARETIRALYLQKKTLAGEAIQSKLDHLTRKGDQLITKRSAYRSRFLAYAARVEQDRIKLVAACQLSGASCYGFDTHGEIIRNFNHASECVAGMEHKRSIGTFYGCETESQTYKTHYQGLKGGFTNEELNALKNNNTKTIYDLIQQKVIE